MVNVAFLGGGSCMGSSLRAIFQQHPQQLGGQVLIPEGEPGQPKAVSTTLLFPGSVLRKDINTTWIFYGLRVIMSRAL